VRAHEISDQFTITARQAFNAADSICRIFELMTCPVPINYLEELWLIRLNAQNLLNIEEIHKANRYVLMGGQLG
jgi:hypothetical protein